MCGWFVAPTGWPLALQAIVAFVIASAMKIGTYRLLEHRVGRQARHPGRVERHEPA